MKAILSKDLFKKEPKKIIRRVGLFYAGIGAWCYFGLTLMESTFDNFPKDEEFDNFNKTGEILQNIWSIYMPLLMIIGVVMVAFSYVFERVKEQQIVIQTGIFVASAIWVIAYSIASIPYINSIQNISPELETFNVLMKIAALFAFGAVFCFMTLPNYKVLKKMKTENTDI